MTTPGTGRLVRHDPASRGYEAPRAVIQARSVMHRLGPVLNQGEINGCTGWSGADFLNSALAVANRRRWNARYRSTKTLSSYVGDDAGLELYKLATRDDNFGWTYPPSDKGSSGLGVLKVLKGLGVIELYQWTFSFDQLIAWGQLQPVMIGTLWTDAMSDPDSKGLIRIGTPAQVRSAEEDGLGHEYILRGINWPRKRARIRNHWTTDWGIHGEADIPLDDLEALVMQHKGDVAVPQVAAA